MSTITETTVATQTYQLYVKATPEAIWDAITNPDTTQTGQALPFPAGEC